eukprot:PRCOL_00004587-RA
MARRAPPPRGVARPPAFLAAALAALLVLRATSDHDGGGGGEESATEAPALVPNGGDASAPPPVTDGGARVLFELDSLARARVEVTGDTIELGNRSEESVPLGGSLTADVRCANTSVGAVDGVRLIDANMSFAFVPPCDAPDSPCEEYDGWSADVLAVLSPALKVLAARMHVIDTIIGTRSVANTFTDAPPAGSDEQLEAAAAFQAQVAAAGNWSAFSSTNESALVPTYYPLGEVRGWATDGVMRLSNDAEQLGLVFDAAVPLPDTVGNSFDGGEGTLNEVVVALTGGAAAAPQSHLVLGMTEKILVPTEVTLRNVDLGLTAAARQVFELITNGTTIDILLSVEAVGANPCL